MSDPLDLSPEQHAAARAPLGDLCVLAGAGSGKTRVLTARFVEHVLRHDLSPRQVGALTFTEKAAREMRKRIGEALHLVGHADLAREAAEAPIATIHAFCARLLRRNAVAVGLDPAFRVLDQDAALLLEAEALERAQERLAAHVDAPRLRAALARVSGSDPLRVLFRLRTEVRAAGGDVRALAWRAGRQDVASARRGAQQAARELADVLAAWPAAAQGAVQDALRVEGALAGAGDLEAAWQAVLALKVAGKGSQPVRAARSALQEALEALEAARLDVEGRERVLPALVTIAGEIERAYVELKARREALDFTDLEREAVRLFEVQAQAGRPVEGLPRALLVDEHQDTNPLQERILAGVRAHGVTQFSVGDPKQSIYRFRRADVRVLLGEQERVGAAGRRALASSYRATPELVAALNGLFARLFDGGRAGVPFAPLSAAGTFRPGAAGDPPPLACAWLDRGERSADVGRRGEAAVIARWLQSIVEGGVRRRLARHDRPLGYGDCAILFRAAADMRHVEQALTAAGIPFRVHRGRGYLGAEEIEALVQALRSVHNPADLFALAAFLRGPALAATDADLLGWFAPGADPWPRLRADERPRVREVLATLGELRRLAVRADLPTVVGQAVERLGLLAAALAQPDGLRRAANLRRAVALAEDLAAGGRHDLPAFLRHLELLDDLEVQQAEAPALGDDGAAVTLLTVHAAKGLEWPVVVLADAGRKGPGRTHAYLLEGAEQVALRLRDELEGESARPGGLVELDLADQRAEAQESLRLLYVALTRAEQHLLVTATHQGATSHGELKGAAGWPRDIMAALGLGVERGVRAVALGAGALELRIEPLPDDVPAADVPPKEAPPADAAAPTPSAGETTTGGAGAQAEAAIAAATPYASPLGGTRFVVSVSEVLTFAERPSAVYEARLVPRGQPSPAAAARPARERGDDRGRDGAGGAGEEEAPREAQAAERWDEPRLAVAASPGPRLDRAALGTAVHLALERWDPARPEARLAERAVEDELGREAPAEAHALARTMVERFERSAVARDLARALAQGPDGGARREAAFHARIRFPAGAEVAGFQHLLVRGTVDLWLPREATAGRAGGVWIVDHKTNPPTQAHPTPESLARHYAPQLRLYALAAERLLGRDVAGAALLLLDPGWGPEALEVPIAIEGPALEETRRICQAFAVAELEDRWPEDWRALLA